jgi:hypothetical protein
VTRLGDARPTRAVDEAVLTARHRVLAAGSEGIRMEVRVERPGSAPRTFVVRFDRAGQLAGIESVEGLPVGILGDVVGVSEVFPATAGGPPGTPLAPGDRWALDEPVELPGAEPARLVGRGRLDELAARDGRDLATVSTSARLPLRRSSSGPQGTVRVDGTQVTIARTTYDLADGAVHDASSRATGRFSLVLEAPPGQAAPPVPGTVTIDVRAETRRVEN